jgi:hypothetical protein
MSGGVVYSRFNTAAVIGLKPDAVSAKSEGTKAREQGIYPRFEMAGR